MLVCASLNHVQRYAHIFFFAYVAVLVDKYMLGLGITLRFESEGLYVQFILFLVTQRLYRSKTYTNANEMHSEGTLKQNVKINISIK